MISRQSILILASNLRIGADKGIAPLRIDEDSSIMELDAFEPCEIALSISVRFPVGDYQRLNDLIRK